MRAAVIDIETTALEGVGAGILLAAVIRPTSTNRNRVFRIQYREAWDMNKDGFLEAEEKELLYNIIEELGKYDLIIGHNIANFDLPYLRSRAEAHGMPFYLRPFYYDTLQAWGRVKMRTVLNMVGKPSKSLDMIADFLGIDQLKTKIYPRAHWLTVWGNTVQREEAMKQLVDHCERDVRMNAEVYNIVLPLDYRGTIKRWM